MDARARILRAAREEFMVNGFRDASLRTIARESGVAVSNIYNYFEHKAASSGLCFNLSWMNSGG